MPNPKPNSVGEESPILPKALESDGNATRTSTTNYENLYQKSDEQYYVNLFERQTTAIGLPSGMIYENKRARNQLQHYFNTSQYPTTDRPDEIGHSEAPKRVTKKDIERFKKRKEEKKRLRNKWLYE